MSCGNSYALCDLPSEASAVPALVFAKPRDTGQLHFVSGSAQSVSVIIPTLNEAAYLARAIESARQNGAGEIIVVDGGSTDATCRIAIELADRWLSSQRGRAVQMNYGAQHARGEWLCFLHADCVLARDALALAVRYLTRPGIVAACFRQRHFTEDWRFRFLDAGAHLRTRWLGLAYGDQGLVIHRRTFEQLGGFPIVPIFEDALLCHKLQRFGRIVILPRPIFVSPRRWYASSFWAVTLRNWLLFVAWQLGVSLPTLARCRPPYSIQAIIQTISTESSAS